MQTAIISVAPCDADQYAFKLYKVFLYCQQQGIKIVGSCCGDKNYLSNLSKLCGKLNPYYVIAYTRSDIAVTKELYDRVSAVLLPTTILAVSEASTPTRVQPVQQTQARRKFNRKRRYTEIDDNSELPF